MNRKSIAILIFLAVLFVLPMAFSSSYCHACTTPRQSSACCEPLKLTGQEYKCVNCNNGTCDLKLYYYYNWASESPKIESLGRVSACDSRCGGIAQNCSNNSPPVVRILPCGPAPCDPAPNYEYDCRGVLRVKVNRNNGDVVESYDCTKEGKICQNGACVNAPKPASKYEWRCSSDGRYRIWFDYVNNEESRRERCLFGKTCSNGACIVPTIFQPTQPSPPCTGCQITPPSNPVTTTECESTGMFWWMKWFSVTRNSEGDVLSREECNGKCDKETGRCVRETQETQSTSASNRVFCNANNKIVLIEVTYSNGEKRTRNKTVCGGCQTCVEVRGSAECQGPTSGTCTTTRYNLEVTTSSTSSSSRTYYYTNNRNSSGSSSSSSNSSGNSYNSGSSNYSGSGSNSNGSTATYYRSSDSSSSQRPGITASVTYGRYYRRSYENSWDPVEQECTANSDCYQLGLGARCSFEENGNFCRRG